MDMEELMKKAQEAAENIQKQMNDVQVKLDSIEVEGTSGGGLVKIRATAKGRILSVSIDDSLIVGVGPGDEDAKQMLEDLVTAAFNDARAKADQAANAEMQKAQSGMGLPPGLNLPGMG
jgi:DNA-binding YbaB/EbfC family protein